MIVKKSVTMSDVAERAGVSKVAVSVVLHGSRTSTRVGEATRERILQAARDLRYTPNGVAQALRRQRMNVIGFYHGDRYIDTHNLFYAEIISGLQWGCHNHRQDLLIHGAFRGQRIEDIYAELINGKIDGLVMFAETQDPLALQLATASVPVVTIADTVVGIPSVVVDDAAGSVLLADYLVSKGHRCVLYRKGLATQTSSLRRAAAFREAAAARGMVVLEDDALYLNMAKPLTERERAFLAGPAAERPTAIACCTDLVAQAALEFCEAQGLRVPADIAVVGFDGIVPAMRPAVRITSIRAPWSEVAETAIKLLYKKINGEEIPLETVLPVELAAGETA